MSGQVVSLAKQRENRAKGAAICTAIAATKLGFDAMRAEAFALTARELVMGGRSAGMAVTICRAYIRREAASLGPQTA